MTTPPRATPAEPAEETLMHDHVGKTAKSAPTAPNQRQEPGPPRGESGAPIIPLGAHVRFARRIDRVDSLHCNAHSWRAQPDTPGEGIFVGYRYKQSDMWRNDSDWETSSASHYWQEDSRVKVALVLTNAWHDPLTVDPDGLEVSP